MKVVGKFVAALFRIWRAETASHRWRGKEESMAEYTTHRWSFRSDEGTSGLSGSSQFRRSSIFQIEKSMFCFMMVLIILQRFWNYWDLHPLVILFQLTSAVSCCNGCNTFQARKLRCSAFEFSIMPPFTPPSRCYYCTFLNVIARCRRWIAWALAVNRFRSSGGFYNVSVTSLSFEHRKVAMPIAVNAAYTKCNRMLRCNALYAAHA